MNNKDYRQTGTSTNWTVIGACILALAVGTYSYVDGRITSISTQYRTEMIAQLMNKNSDLQKTKCDTPYADEINELITRGVKTDNVDAVNLVSKATYDRCEAAKAEIDMNQEISRNAKAIKVPSKYITKNFL